DLERRERLPSERRFVVRRRRVIVWQRKTATRLTPRCSEEKSESDQASGRGQCLRSVFLVGQAFGAELRCITDSARRVAALVAAVPSCTDFLAGARFLSKGLVRNVPARPLLDRDACG